MGTVQIPRPPRKIIVSVTSNISLDQRVQKECNTLLSLGFDILVIDKKTKQTSSSFSLPYNIIHIHTFFSRGPFMYAVFNTSLFFHLLFRKADLLWANDLDTLLPNFLVAKLKGKKLIYDSHEYFTECIYKKTPKAIWTEIERRIFPRLKNVITVNDSIKKAYRDKYNVPIIVVKNTPYTLPEPSGVKADMWDSSRKILLIQGTGINKNRGAEEALLTMQHLPDDFILYFIGAGNVWDKLKVMANQLQLNHKVVFLDSMPYHEMMNYTRFAFLGLILENINASKEHLYASPNKLFDYIHAGIPILTTPAVEVTAIVKKYEIGIISEDLIPENIAQKILHLASDTALYATMKINTVSAANDHCWEKEEQGIIRLINNLA